MYWSQLLVVASIHLLAVMSPGPDFILISRNALVYSRKVGIYSALGLALGIAVHVTYSIIGIGFIIAQSVLLFTLIKLVGACYLIYLGIKCLRAKKVMQAEEASVRNLQEMKPLAALRMGFLTNVLNPKATLFFLALFTQVIRPDTPAGFQMLYGFEMVVATFAWFAFVAVVLSHGIIQRRFAAIQHHFERVFGVILVGIGLKVALSDNK
jgi:RhtB (resistance to homoserine/threonine) family protein